MAIAPWIIACISTLVVFPVIDGIRIGATYDMTNHATVKGWPLNVVVADIVWGTVLTGACAPGGYLATRALTGGQTRPAQAFRLFAAFFFRWVRL